MERLAPPNTESPRLTSTERIWEERIRTMCFYHGTSSLFLDEIKQSGLSPRFRIYPQEYKEAVKVLGLDRNFFAEEYGKFFVSTDFSRSCEYAMECSEGMGELLLNVNSALRDKHLAHHSQHLANTVKEWCVELFCQHRPVLAVVDRNSVALNRYLEKRHHKIYLYLTDRDYFVGVARQKSVKWNTTAEQASYSIEDQIAEQLADFPVKARIPAEDLHFITGDEFWDQYQELRVYGNAIQQFLFDIEKRPPALVDITGGLLLGYYKGHSTLDIEMIIKKACIEFGLSKEDEAKIRQRVLEHLKSTLKTQAA